MERRNPYNRTQKLISLFVLFSFLLSPLSAEDAYAKALLLYEQKNYDACLSTLKAEIRGEDENSDLRILAAYCHIGKKSYSDALYHLQQAVRKTSVRDSVYADIVSLLFEMGRYRQARNAGYKYIEVFEDAEKAPPLDLQLALAKACLVSARISEALKWARAAKQSDDNSIKHDALLTEARALISLGKLDEAEIAVSYAEAIQKDPTHALLRAMIQEVLWAQKSFPEQMRHEVLSAYEELTKSPNPKISQAAQKNIERVRAQKAP
ncbi:MAG: hypothetical protein LDLANPLL_02346 [Turneriella sp.]|nr:hypothetical protein [Turneriella sp.]